MNFQMNRNTNKETHHVTRLAKAMSALTHGRGGIAAGSNARSFATRASSLGADGTGARSRRPVVILGLAIVTFAFLALTPLALASKTVHTVIGEGSYREGASFDGGLLLGARGVTVNVTGTGGAAPGDFYIAGTPGNRIDQFSASGAFIRAFGRDVIEGGKSNDNGGGYEICDVTAGNAASDCKQGAGEPAEGGTLSSPHGIAVDQATGNLYVSNSNLLRVEEFDATGHFVRTFGLDVDATDVGTGFEICSAAANCQSGTNGSTNGAFEFGFNGYLAVAPAAAPNAGNVLVADTGNHRVNEYTSAGAFVRSFGFDVTDGNATTTFETCDAADGDACKAGIEGSEVGQFAGVDRVAVDPSGVIYTVESTNMRVQKFVPSGSTLTPVVFAPGLLSGTAFEDKPTDVAAGESGHVFVVKGFPAGTGTPPASAEEQRILELDSSGALLDTHLANARIRNILGLAANPENGRLYITEFLKAYVLADAGALAATIDAATDVGGTSATFNGSVDPGGVLGEHHFEYVTDEQFQVDGFASATVLPSESSGNGSSLTAVSRAVAGLDPLTLYHVRLVVEQSYGTASAVSSGTTFTTASAKPTLAPFANADSGETSTTLSSRVIPHGQATTYFFEWGATATYGNTTPVRDAGSGSVSVFASAEIFGLSPGTTYHFRLVATNGAGTSEGDDETFATAQPVAAGACPNAQFRIGAGANLPGCRAYEQVSPVDKNGGDIKDYKSDSVERNQFSIGLPSAPSGDAVFLKAEAQFADAASGGTGATTYLARRDPGDWVTHAIGPRVSPPTANVGTLFSTPDLTESVLKANGDILLDPPHHSDYPSFYRRDNLSNVITHYFDLPRDAGQKFFVSPYMVPTLDRLFFSNAKSLTSDPGVPSSSYLKLYEKVDDGPFKLTSILPDGTPAQEDTVIGGFHPDRNTSRIGAVSDDGAHVFFTLANPFAGPYEVYRRSNGTTTISVTPSKRTPIDSVAMEFVYRQLTFFQRASPDGNRVLFSSHQELTDDANTGPARNGLDLYRYDVEADRLIDISATVAGDGAKVLKVLGADAELERVYYAAEGQVVPGEGVADQANLYLWEDDGSSGGTTRFIAALDPADVTANFVSEPAATSDGRYLAFGSAADIPGGGEGGVAQVYRYDADAAGGAGDLTCVSCSPLGGSPIGPAFIPRAQGPGGLPSPWERPRPLTANGDIFFTSQEALVPADTNGMDDVYFWNDGELNLLSSGTSSRDSTFSSASPDGNNVFILTADPLVPQDGDDLMDLYDVKVNGGFASQFATPPPGCTGEECRGAGSQNPPGPAPLSSSLQGAGNVAARSACKRPSRGAKRLSRRAKGLSRKAAAARRQGKAKQATRMQRRARKLGKRAGKLSKRAKRCRARARAERRAQR